MNIAEIFTLGPSSGVIRMLFFPIYPKPAFYASAEKLTSPPYGWAISVAKLFFLR
jgi:hypothetical protein